VDAGEETLETVERGLSFDGAECGLAASATVVAALGNGGGAGSAVGAAEKMEAGLFEETFVFPAEDEEVAADGTANGELFVGDDTGDDESIAETEAASPLENAEKFAKSGETIGNVAHGVVRIDGVKGGVGEREMRGRVVKEEGDAGLQRFRMRQGDSAPDALEIDVKRGYAAAGGFGEVQGAASGAAADFEGGGVFRELQEARNFREFFR